MRWRKDTFQKNDEPKAENFFIIVSMAVGYKITAVSIFESIILQKDIFRLGHEIKNALHLVEENSISKIVRFQTIFGKKKELNKHVQKTLNTSGTLLFLTWINSSCCVRISLMTRVYTSSSRCRTTASATFAPRPLQPLYSQWNAADTKRTITQNYAAFLWAMVTLKSRTSVPELGLRQRTTFFLFANEGQSAPFLLGNT